jgi:pimeloyl-ACP methyl ester carboxylesterase
MKITEYCVDSNGLKLFVEDRGHPDHPVVLLIMGLGGQLTLWPEGFLDALVDLGYRIIRFDNRDIGLSTKIEPRFSANIPLAYTRFMIGLNVDADYTLYDMADDSIGVLDALGIERAHVVGASMGGMIAQIVAAQNPHRVRSLSLLMTTCNEARLAAINLPATWHLCRSRFIGETREAYLSVAMGYWKAIQSPAYPTPIDAMIKQLEQDFERSYHPCGIERQVMAIAATGSLRHLSRQILQPTQIIHGEADPLLRVVGARMLAKHVRHAQLKVFPGMGHDMPEPLLADFADLIHNNAVRARTASQTLGKRSSIKVSARHLAFTSGG